MYQEIKNKLYEKNFDHAKKLAIKIYKKNHQDHYICMLLGEIFLGLKKYNKSEKYFFLSIKIKKETTNIFSLGNFYLQLKKYQKAVIYFNKVIKLDNNFILALNNLAFCFNKLGNSKKSIKYILKAIKISKNNHHLLHNAANAYKTIGDLNKAEEYYNKAIVIAPNDKRCLFNKSFVLLKKRKYQDGWNLYENRLNLDNLHLNVEIHSIIKNHLYHNNNFNNKNLKLSIISEQGVGDQILFSSMFGDLIKIYPNTSFFVDKRLIPIFKKSFKSKNFFSLTNKKLIKNKIKQKNNFLYMGSLGKFFRKKSSDFKIDSYLISNNKNKDKIKKKLSIYKNKTIIGISWKSHSKSLDKGDIKLESLKKIFGSNSYVFVNLQYGSLNKEIKKLNSVLSNNIIEFKGVDLFNDLESLCAIIDSLDCVITIDNINAQISGALGVKTFVITPYNNENFIFSKLNKDKCDWYPSMNVNYINTNNHSNYNKKLINLIKKIKLKIK